MRKKKVTEDSKTGEADLQPKRDHLTASTVLATAASLVPGIVVVGLNVACREVDLKFLKHISCVCINLNGVLLDERGVWDIVEFLLALLLLKLKRDTADGSTLDAAHQVSEVPGDLVAHALSWHDSNLIDNTFVNVEVKCEAVVVLLDDLARSALDGLSADASPVE